ncbi:MAG TPA: pseudouridine synthase [Pirellulales bacterium]|jgi:23S rRNA pseudouridine2605 synthase|nr:pseudouridine synthase [Pirellulales bacterium]
MSSPTHSDSDRTHAARTRPKRRRQKSGGATPRSAASPGGERLQKVMAAAGIGSRRQCEELILAGRVEVDRKTVTELGTKVDPTQQEVRVDGTALGRSRKLYYLVNKPMGALSTNFDPSGRPRVVDLVPESKERLFTVGRLDLSSEGLILVTNDGELANRLAHPRYGVEKTYQVLVAGTPEREVFDQLRQGIHLAEGPARVVSVRVKSRLKKSTVLEIVLAEGRNREIRRLLAKVGHKVLRLKRIALGPVKLKDLSPGDCRRLTGEELRALRFASRHRTVPGDRSSDPDRSDDPAQSDHARAASPAVERAPAKSKAKYPPSRPKPAMSAIDGSAGAGHSHPRPGKANSKVRTKRGPKRFGARAARATP